MKYLKPDPLFRPNLIAEFDAVSTLTLVRSYTWGLDIVGSLTATGGVGALVQIHDHAASKTFLPTYDGNGNVVSLLNADGGAVAAVYEYGPFGEPMRTEILDAAVADQPFRFSSKFTDRETGLVYYGYRLYSPALGRFINRDPIGEQGGMNLYGFAGNDGVNRVDYLGLKCYFIPNDEEVKGLSASAAFWLPTGGFWACVDGDVYTVSSISGKAITIADRNNNIVYRGARDSFTNKWIVFDDKLGPYYSGPNVTDIRISISDSRSASGPGGASGGVTLAPNNEDPKCDGLRQQRATNIKSRDSMLADFGKGGMFESQAALLSGEDKLNLGQILIGAGVDVAAARAQLQATRGIPMGGQLTVEATRYPTGAANSLGALSKGIGILGVGVTVYATADAAVDGKVYETANGALNVGAGVYALTGPIGWAVGAGQGVIGLAQIGWNAHWNDFSNKSTASAAQNVRGMITKADERINGINEQMAALGCK